MADSVVIPFGWDRAAMAAEKVKERLKRSTAALERAGVAYAVVGGNAVAEWVGRVDEDAVRNTRDVDILIRRADLPAAKAALARQGSSIAKASASICSWMVPTAGPPRRCICCLPASKCG